MAITPGDLIGGHGNADKKFEDFMQRLLNHDDFDIDAYLCGHDALQKSSYSHLT